MYLYPNFLSISKLANDATTAQFVTGTMTHMKLVDDVATTLSAWGLSVEPDLLGVNAKLF